MGDRPLPSPSVGQERTVGIELAEALAALVRALTFYPETNSRVQSNLRAVLDANSKVFAGTTQNKKSQITIVFSREGVSVEDDKADFPPGSSLSWLAHRLETCGLSGLLLFEDLPASSLMEFSKCLLDAYRRSSVDPEFEGVDLVELQGLRPLAQRFEGSFDGTPEMEEHTSDDILDEQVLRSREEELAARLLRRPEIRERVESLASEVLEEEEQDLEMMSSLDLISRIVRALPLESVQHGEQVVKHTIQVLDEVVEQWVPKNERGRDPLGRALLSASLDLFTRRSWGPTSKEEEVPEPVAEGDRVLVSPASRGHPTDDLITDDLQALLTEVAKLPPSEESDLKLLRAEDPAEQVGVYLHYLVHLEAEEDAQRLQSPLAKLLRSAGNEEKSIMQQYVAVLHPEHRGPISPNHRPRLLNFLYCTGLTRMLAENGAFTADMAQEMFPEDFGVYLDSLDLRDPHKHAELARLLIAVGPERIARNAQQLIGDARLLDPVRTNLILGRADPAMAPIARIVLARGDALLKEVVANYVRRLDPGGEETCLLQLLPDAELPRDYLADLIDPPTSPALRKVQHTRISECLCAYIESLAASAPRAGRRIAAIRMLALFQSERSTELLKRLVGGRNLMFVKSEPTEVRDVAKSSLACYV